MTAVLLTLHTLIVLGLIGVVLLQRSDGAALGMGGGGSGGGFMSGRGAANALTRTTSILAALFFATSLTLAVTAGSGADEEDRIEALTGDSGEATEPEPLSTRDLLETVGSDDEPTGEIDASGTAPVTEEELLESLGAAVEPTPADAGALEQDAETAEATSGAEEDAGSEDEPAAEDETPQG